MGMADEDGLIDCNEGTYLLVKENNEISKIGSGNSILYISGEESTEGFTVQKDSIKTVSTLPSMDQGGTKYNLSIFYNNGWDYKISNEKWYDKF